MLKKASTVISPQIRNPDVEQMDFRFTIRNVKQLTTYTSPVVRVNSLPWQVKLKRNGENVTIELCCNYAHPKTNWSCAARALFKLMSFASNSAAHEKRQDVVAVFSTKLSSITRAHELVKWHDLFDSKKQFVCNNAIVVDVTIQAEKLRENGQNNLIDVLPISGRATFRFKLTKVRGIIAVDSPEFVFRNANCHLTVSKRYPLTKVELDEYKHGYLGIWLVSSNFVHTSNYEIQVNFRLISHRLHGKHFEKLADSLSLDRFNFSSRFIPLKTLYGSDCSYVHNDSITLEVDINVKHINNFANANSVLNAHTGAERTSLSMECILCYENMIDQSISSTPCGHVFCRQCIIASLRVRASCPICNKTVTEDIHDIFLPAIRQN